MLLSEGQKKNVLADTTSLASYVVSGVVVAQLHCDAKRKRLQRSAVTAEFFFCFCCRTKECCARMLSRVRGDGQVQGPSEDELLARGQERYRRLQFRSPVGERGEGERVCGGS